MRAVSGQGVLLGLLACTATFGWADAGGQVRSFRADILPILTKAGCNAGACHGAATGQGGFKLSLLGYDPEEDYARITREWAGRRIDVRRPESSLVLAKPSGQIEHEGGRKLPRQSDGYAVLRDWIALGAPLGNPEFFVRSIEVEPREIEFSNTRSNQAMKVTAVMSDLSRRDVTTLALFNSNDDGLAEVSRHGVVTARGRGLTSIMVRYGGEVAAARVSYPFSERRGGARDFPVWNEIDEHIGAELHRMGLAASPLSRPGEFLRRVYLDVTGRLPEPHETREFLSQPDSPERRRQVVDRLLRAEAFTDFWTLKFADLLLLGGKPEHAQAYHRWLRQQIATRAPLDAIVRELMTAEGRLADRGPANFATLAVDARDWSEHAARMFLGLQIGCARCHAHPSDRWTQMDYHQFAAFFARVNREGETVAVASRGEVDHPKTGKPVIPSPLGVRPDATNLVEDRRQALAGWITHADNPWFARSWANRVWKHLLGRGLVEPVDDLRPTNPPTHPALLDALARELTKSGFDLRHLIRFIASSRTYQLSARPAGNNAADGRLYSHALMKELSAPVFADVVAQVTGVPDTFEGYPEGTRAVQLISPSVPSAALDVLGRCARKRSCETGASGSAGLAQALHLINGSTINGKLRSGLVESALSMDPGVWVHSLYERALARAPEEQEAGAWVRLLRDASDRRSAAEDLVWALLNSREFGINQ